MTHAAFVCYIKRLCVQKCSLCVGMFHISTVLCADRVGQMTKTYNDIDAVTRLLEEVRFSIFVCSGGVIQSGAQNFSFSFISL